MKKAKIFLLMLIVLSVILILIAGCAFLTNPKKKADKSAPVPGNSGIITLLNIGAKSLSISWTAATDDNTSQENLEYRVYYATVSSITTPEDAQANATPWGNWTKNVSSADLTGLDEATPYYITVLVRDEEGNMGIYDVVSQTTYLTVTVNFSNVPSNGQSLDLIVTGAGMDDINKTYPVSQSQISDSFELPPGSARIFSAVSSTPSVTLSAEVQKDLLSTADANVTLNLFPTSSKIIIPDAENYRIVQIDDMTGSGWTEKNWESFNFFNQSQFYPYDIDFDSQGRIYIANNNQDEGPVQGVIRIDDINDINFDTIVENQRIVTIAVDRLNNYIYYSDGLNPIYRQKLDQLGSEESFIVGTGNVQISSISVDENGMLYITNNQGIEIIKYDPFTQTNVTTYNANLGSPSQGMDVLSKSGYIYIASYDAPANYKIQKLDQNLIYINGFGVNDDQSPPEEPGEFYGPRQFVAILNKKLTVIDEVSYDNLDRLISFDEKLDGSGWETYGTYGTGVGEFSFFYIY